MGPATSVLLLQTKKEELPPWIRSERERKLQSEEGSDLPFPVYLIGSALVAIAAVGVRLPWLSQIYACLLACCKSLDILSKAAQQ